MARFLFVVPPLVGHVNPTVGVGHELASRGHKVAWAGHASAVKPLLPGDADLLAIEAHVSAEKLDELVGRARTVRGLEAFKFLWDDFFLPLARAMRPGVEAAIERFEPSVLVVDQQAVGGALAARRRGLPWATFATTSAGVGDALAGLPRVRAWLAERLAELEREAGLAAVAEPDVSPHLVVAFSTAALAGAVDRYPAHVRFVGPSFARRPQPAPFPWEALRPGPRVLVSLGTVNAHTGGRFYAATLEALGGGPVQVILAAPPELVGAVPDNVLCRARVPQVDLLPHVQAVVCHGGHNTVCEALAHRLPLVVAPIKDDQPIVAQQVVEAGAGLRLKFGRVTPADIKDAVGRVLHEPAFRDAAARIQASFAEAGGERRAADLLEALV